MPQGIKYLPVALSSMQRKYTNGDRCGIWAMPTLVALRYGLKSMKIKTKGFPSRLPQKRFWIICATCTSNIRTGGFAFWPTPTVRRHFIMP